jgi:hypothetical protein
MRPKVIVSLMGLTSAAGAVYLAWFARSYVVTCVEYPVGGPESTCTTTSERWVEWDPPMVLAAAGAVLLAVAVVAWWRNARRVVTIASALGIAALAVPTWELLVVPVGEHFGLA